MNTNRGATLVELMIAMLVIMIVSLGFFNWLGTVMRMNTSIERSNAAYAMANDVADRLQRMNDNDLIKPGTAKYVGYVTAVTDQAILKGCSGGSPTISLDVGSSGMTTYTNPWKAGAPQELYLYDKNNCEGRTWVDAACGGTSTSTITVANTVTVTTAANVNIDHPNPSALVSAYNSINPIRSYKGTTYYAVWSVAYMPCNAGTNTKRRKIFITVYWIEPEPTDTLASNVVTNIGNGTYRIKSVSLVADKTIGAET